MSSEEPPPDPSVPSVSREKSPSKLEAVANFFGRKSPKASPQPSPKPIEVGAPDPQERSYLALFSDLLDKEISLEMLTLTPGEYAVLVFMYLIQNKPCEARLAAVRGLERHSSDPTLVFIADVSDNVYKNNLSEALKSCNQSEIHHSFKPYLAELTNRLLAQRLSQISKMYSNISSANLVATLGFSLEQTGFVEEFLLKANWPIAPDNYVEISDNPEFRLFIENCHDEAFGNVEKEEEKVQVVENMAEKLKPLIRFADFLDAPTQ